MPLLTDVAVLVVEADTFVGLDIVLEIESMGGTAIGPFCSLVEAQGAMDEAPFAAALINADIDEHVCDLFERLEIMHVPHVAHSSSGIFADNPSGNAPHFTRPIDSRLMLQSLSCEVLRLEEVWPRRV